MKKISFLYIVLIWRSLQNNDIVLCDISIERLNWFLRRNQTRKKETLKKILLIINNISALNIYKYLIAVSTSRILYLYVASKSLNCRTNFVQWKSHINVINIQCINNKLPVCGWKSKKKLSKKWKKIFKLKKES